MLDNLRDEKIRAPLAFDLKSARGYYSSRHGSVDVYIRAPERFSKFVLHGTVPIGFEYEEEGMAGPNETSKTGAEG